MQALVYIGAVMAVIGLAGLAWCIREGLSLRKPGLEQEAAKAKLRKLNIVNMSSLAFGFLGLGVMAAGVILS